MQRNFLGFVLLGLAIISALTTAFLCFQTASAMSENKKANAKFAELQGKMVMFEKLFNEAFEYSKKNPAIIPVLRSAGFTNIPAATSTQPRR